MHTNYLFIDDGSTGQAVEAVSKRFPKLNPKPAFALVIKTIDTVDGRAFVVTSQDEEVFWVFDFIR